ncbi:MAG: hypothetical protein ACRC3Z_01110 [Phocaeicola sp.]
MKTSGAYIDLPKKHNGTSMIAQSITPRDNIVENESDSDSNDSVWKNVMLDNIEVVAQSRRIERVHKRNGEVTLLFHVKANRALFDERWQLSLFPELIENDSIRLLTPIVWNGSEFIKAQQLQNNEYDLFVQSIISVDDYDTVYLDKKGISNDIKKQQKLYFGMYERERKEHIAYNKWLNITEYRHRRTDIRSMGNREHLKQKMSRSTYQKSIDAFIQGLDTVGIRNSYENKYNRIIKTWPKYRPSKELKLRDIPNKYKQLWLSGSKIDDIKNYSFTPKDSIEISTNRFYRKDIVENEYKRDNLNLYRADMIRFPQHSKEIIIEKPTSDTDLSYVYIQNIKVKEGVNKLKLTLKGKVIATDYSVWNIPPNDTITFIIASVTDLINPTLANRFNESTDSLIDSENYDNYMNGVNALKNMQYEKGASILKDYLDYNYAIALLCLNQNSDAENILKKEYQTAEVKYLRAIANTRLKEYSLAAQLLLEACEADEKFIFRKNMDTDIMELIPKIIGLEIQLNRIADNLNHQL